jgi:5'-nucleotidase
LRRAEWPVGSHHRSHCNHNAQSGRRWHRHEQCTINDLIKEEGSYSNQAAWLSHVNDVLSNQVSAGLLNSAQVAEIQAAAAAYDIKRYARVKIIGFNDFHGTLRSPGNLTFSGVATPVGGIDYFAGYVDAMRAKNPANTVILSAGDLIGASPLVSALFHDEGTVEAMNRLGLQGDGSVAYRLDYDAVGNHEFDEGKDELKRMQNGGCHPTDALHTCQGDLVGTPNPFEGAKFKFLSANVVETAAGKTLFPAFQIKIRTVFAWPLSASFWKARRAWSPRPGLPAWNSRMKQTLRIR